MCNRAAAGVPDCDLLSCGEIVPKNAIRAPRQELFHRNFFPPSPRDHLAVPLSGEVCRRSFFWAYNGYWLAAVKVCPLRSYFKR